MSRSIGVPVAAIALLAQAAGCASITHTTSFNDHLITQRDERGTGTPTGTAAAVTPADDGFTLHATEKLTCDTAKVDVISRTRVEHNTVNKPMLVVESLMAVVGIGGGAVASVDVATQKDDTKLLFAGTLNRDQERYAGLGAVVVGALFAVGALVDAVGSIDHESSALRVEEKHKGSEQKVACGDRPLTNTIISVRSTGGQPVALGRTDAQGDVTVHWLELPVELFEGHEVLAKAELVTPDNAVVGLLDLTAGQQVHAERAWTAIVDTGSMADFQKYRERFPGAHVQEATERATITPEKLKELVTAAQQAVDAKNLEAARTAVAALRGRASKDVLAPFEKSLADLEAVAKAEQAVVAATDAVKKAEAKDATIEIIIAARTSIDDGTKANGAAKPLADLTKRLDKAASKTVAGIVSSAGSLSPDDAEAKLALAKQVAPSSPQVTAAIERNHGRMASAAAAAATKLAKDGKPDEARAQLDQIQVRIGARPELDKARAGIADIEKAQAATLAEKQRKEDEAAKREAEKQAKLDAEKAAKDQREAAKLEAKRLEEQKKKEAEDAKKLKAEVEASKKAAAAAQAAAKIEAAKQEKEEAARAKAAAEEAAKKAHEDDLKTPKLIEYRLAASFAAQDVLGKVSVPKCKGTAADIRARVPDCLTCLPEPMRMLSLTCTGDTKVDFVKSKERVWARCSNQTCDDCKSVVANAMAPFKAGKLAPTVAQTCESAKPPAGAGTGSGSGAKPKTK